MTTSQDPRCCGSGTCIIDEQGQCWCGQRWDGQKMSRPAAAASAAALADEASDAYASTLQGDLDSAWAPTLPTLPTDLRS